MYNINVYSICQITVKLSNEKKGYHFIMRLAQAGVLINRVIQMEVACSGNVMNSGVKTVKAIWMFKFLLTSVIAREALGHNETGVAR